MITHPTPTEIEIANTEVALEDTREELDITMHLLRAYVLLGNSRPDTAERYVHYLREVHWLEQYGQALDPDNPIFQPQEPSQ